jgi:4a-hydroxytetrahydrobiopterin dehydratase
MKQLKPEWQLADDGKSIAAQWKFRNFFHTMSFGQRVAHIANTKHPHPDLRSLSYSYYAASVTTTHAIGGLSENDFICAAKIDALSGTKRYKNPRRLRPRLRARDVVAADVERALEFPAAPTVAPQSNCAPAPKVVTIRSKLDELELPLMAASESVSANSIRLVRTASSCRQRHHAECVSAGPAVSSSR